MERVSREGKWWRQRGVPGFALGLLFIDCGASRGLTVTQWSIENHGANFGIKS
jgi:hypothetical protein